MLSDKFWQHKSVPSLVGRGTVEKSHLWCKKTDKSRLGCGGGGGVDMENVKLLIQARF